jgi:hypothetical protein
MQEFVATAAIGTSALRNQGKGSHRAARRALAALDLTVLRRLPHGAYGRWLDDATDSLLVRWPGGRRPWGAARKSVNLFMRDALYNRYLEGRFRIRRVERAMEVALDSKVAAGLRDRYPRLPTWPGLRHLTPDVSVLYQSSAQDLAKVQGVSRVHLDIWLWLENR